MVPKWEYRSRVGTRKYGTFPALLQEEEKCFLFRILRRGGNIGRNVVVVVVVVVVINEQAVKSHFDKTSSSLCCLRCSAFFHVAGTVTAAAAIAFLTYAKA